MKANYQDINASELSSLLFMHYKQDVEDAISLHFHPEYELTYVVKGHGKRIVGGQVEYFNAGDLILVNSNISHCWIYEKEAEGSLIENMVIQFSPELIQGNFINLPEFEMIKKMFNSIKSGVILKGATQQYVSGKMLEMEGLNDFERLLLLLDILQKIAMSDESLPIDGFMNPVKISVADMSKFQKAYTYILSNYSQPISLEDIAGEVSMSPTAFCRFFKKISRKTFVEFLCEYRIQVACRLLRETDSPVWEVCFLCGFTDTPHFNRMFKKIKNVSPLQYRKLQA